MQTKPSHDRRRFLRSGAGTGTGTGTGTAAFGGLAGAQAFDFKSSQRYPDPGVLILDPSLRGPTSHLAASPQALDINRP